MLDDRAETLKSLGLHDHAFFLYEDEDDKNHLFSDFIERRIREGDMVSIMSDAPNHQTQVLRASIRKLNDLLERGSLKILDGKLIASSKNPPSSWLERIRNLRRQARNYGGWSHMGDWFHILYSQFDYVGMIEQNFVKLRLPVRCICCYRTEGFASLDIRDIANSLKLHSHVLFGRPPSRQRVD